MATVNQTVEVDVPVSAAYNQWTQFESFPKFMKGVESVDQIDETALHFSTKVGGVRRDYNAQILEQVPDSLISWASIDGPRNAGTVRFEALGAARTRVSVEIEWEPEGFTEKAGSLVGADDLRVSADLEKFKDFIEDRGRETGAWRGTVAGGDVEDTGAAAGVGTTAEIPPVDPDLIAPSVAEENYTAEDTVDDATAAQRDAEWRARTETRPDSPGI
ncbi:SRPBCC family protein [bacterium RCC_150]